jgi:amino acid transporter
LTFAALMGPRKKEKSKAAETAALQNEGDADVGKTETSAAPSLRRVMWTTEYFTLAFGCIVGVGWVVVIGKWLKSGGPGGAMLAYLVCGIALVPVALAYGRLAQRMPDAGSEIAYTAAVFPPVVSFLTGWAMTFGYLIVCPFEAVAIGQLAAYLLPFMNEWEVYRIGEYPVYLPYLVLGVGTTLAIAAINYRGIRLSARLQNWATFALLAVFCVFVPLALWRGSLKNMKPLFAKGDNLHDAFLSTLAVLPIVPYFLMGFETVPKCAEEAAPGFEPRRFGPVMLLGLAVGTLFYVAIIAAVALLEPWQHLGDQDFATAIALERAFQSKALVWGLIFGAALSLLKVFNGMFLGTTRLLYAMGRRGLLGAGLGVVDARFGTPRAAILLVCAITLPATFFGQAVLDPITTVGSVAGALGWMAACLALSFGAGGQTSGGARALGLCGAAVSLALAVVAAWGFAWYQWLAVAVWAVLGLLLWLSRPEGAPAASESTRASVSEE